VRVEVSGKYSGGIPLDPMKNTAGLAVKHLLEKYGLSLDVKIKILKGIKPGCGLGSSGASAAAAVYGLSRLLGLNLSLNQLVEAASHGEIASASVPHADNVAASIYGGFVIVLPTSPIKVLGFKPPRNLGLVAAIPNIKVPMGKTMFARSILPKNVKLSSLSFNVAYASSLVTGMLTSNLKLIGESLRDDVVEAVRAKYIPGYFNLREAAMNAGALGFTISGAGPSILAVIEDDRSIYESVKGALKDVFEEEGVEAEIYFAKPAEGVKEI